MQVAPAAISVAAKRNYRVDLHSPARGEVGRGYGRGDHDRYSGGVRSGVDYVDAQQ
jgi:hypothetical protein